MIALFGGVLWRQMGGGAWYTLDEVAPGLYAYRYADDPSQGEPSPAHSGAGGLAGDSETPPEGPEGMERPQGSAGRAQEGT